MPPIAILKYGDSSTLSVWFFTILTHGTFCGSFTTKTGAMTFSNILLCRRDGKASNTSSE